MLPSMSVIINSIEYAAERQTNKMRRVIKSRSISDGEMDEFLNPVPYNVGFTLSIWSLHMVDVDQILEQILPFFTPVVFTRINMPELDATLDIKIAFLTCAPENTIDMPDEEVRIVKWNVDFIAHTYLFKPVKNTKIITKIIQKLYTDESSWGHRFTESAFTSGAGPDDYEPVALYTKAIPPYFNEDDWEASTFYEVGDIVKPTETNGYLYEVQYVELPGKSGTTEPDWPIDKETPIIDNDITWERYEHDEYRRLVELERFGD
jgi:hypothetical protein